MGWSYSGVAATVILQIGASVVFARLLGPQVIGVFSFGLLVFAPFRFLCEFGLGSALVQKRGLVTKDIQMALGRSIILALIVAAAWFLSIGAFAALVHEERDSAALRSFALAFVTFPVQALCTAVLSRRLEQKHLQIGSIAGYAAGYLAIGAYGALHGWGVWSLTVGFLAQNAISTSVLFAYARLNLEPRLRGEAAFLWHFGARVTAINISNWLTSSLDNLAVAWFFGARPLGLYSVAYGLVRSPADKIVTTLQNVLFPTSVLVRDDPERLAKGCIATLDATFMVAAPAFCTLAILAHTTVSALYGAEWEQAAEVLPPLALSMIFHCLTVVIGALLWGSGGVASDLRIQWICAVVFLAGVIVAGRYSMAAIAWVVLPVTLLRAGWGIAALTKTVGVLPARLCRGLFGGATLAAFIAPVLYCLDTVLSRHGSPSALVRFAGDASAALVIWAGLGLVLRERLMTPELKLGWRSLQLALGRPARA